MSQFAVKKTDTGFPRILFTNLKAGIFLYALAFLAGVMLVQQWHVLPTNSSVYLFIAGCSCSCLLAYSCFRICKNRFLFKSEITLIIKFILLFCIGIIYSIFFASQRLEQQLDSSLTGKNIIITGEISSIPVRSSRIQRFEFDVSRFRIKDESNNKAGHFPQKIRLSWYYGKKVNAGEKWQFEVRLKPPRGFMNPGGFDYEAWLFQQGFHATGYVRKSSANDLLQDVSSDAVPRHSNESSDGLSDWSTYWRASRSITYLRQSISLRLDWLSGLSRNAERQNSYALLKALAVGDKSTISARQWQILRDTGTSHLMAISGLHIGLAAMFAYAAVRRLVPASVMKHIPAQHLATLAGMFVGLMYAILAGLSVPTQRAVIMLFALSLMLLLRRNHRPVDALGLAILLVLLFDPLAVLSAGFWFSFSAVAVIYISLKSADDEHSVTSDSQSGEKMFAKVGLVLKRWLRLQLLISIFLMPLSLFMFQQVSMVSPLANFVLIPFVSFLVVPVVLIALLILFIRPSLADYLFDFSAYLLDLVWPYLVMLSQQPHAIWVNGDIGIFKLLMATISILLLYYSRAILRITGFRSTAQRWPMLLWSSRLLYLLPLVPVFMRGDSGLSSGDYKLAVLDVGQGSAAVIQTQQHTLVFDSGAKFSDKFDIGSGVVIPYLRSQAVQDLDRLIISHGDADHIGGAQAILDAYPDTRLVGQDIEKLHSDNKTPCYEGMRWRWDGVDFEILSPSETGTGKYGAKRNDLSCVLKVGSASGVVLITGDIEKAAEDRLLQTSGDELPANILLVPHHGSKTSSSRAFVEKVSPELAIISVGYKNRYRLPASRVLSRYRSIDSQLLRTDESGALLIELSGKNGIDVKKYREISRRYWHY